MADIRVPSMQELLAALQVPMPKDTSREISQGAISGIELANTIATRKEQQEERKRALKDKILKAKLAAEQRGRVESFRQEPSMENIRAAFPEAAAEDILSRQRAEEQHKQDLILQAQKTKDAATKKQQKTAASIQRAQQRFARVGVMVNQMKDAVQTMEETGITGPIGAGRVGLDQMTGGFFGKFLGVDPKITSWEQARDAFGRRLYKDLSGDVGNIAQQEGKFAKRLLPSAKEAPTLRAEKIARVEKIIAESQQALFDLEQRRVAEGLSDREFTLMAGRTVDSIIERNAATLPENPDPTKDTGIPGETGKLSLEQINALGQALGLKRKGQ